MPVAVADETIHRRTSKPAVIAVLVAAAAGVGQGFGRFVFPTLLPAMKQDLLGSYSGAGFLGTANVAAYLFGAVVVMFASLRRPADQILKVGLCLSTAGMVLLATAQGMPQLVAGMFCAGVGGASIWVPSPGIVGSVFPPERRGAVIGIVNAGIGVALVGGTQLGRFAANWWGPHGWRWVWAIQGMVAAGVTIIALIWLRPPRVRVAAPPRLAALREAPAWKMYLAGYFLLGFGYIVIITYAVAALRDDGGFSSGHAANDYALLGVGTIFGGLVLGRLSDRTSRRLAMGLGYGLSGLCPLLLLTAQEPLVGAAALVFGALFSGSVVVVAAYLADHVAPAEFGAAFATATVAFGAAQALGPQVGGTLADHTGSFTLTFLVGSTALLAAAATTPALAGRRR